MTALLCLLVEHQTLRFAADELARCLTAMTGQSIEVQTHAAYRADLPALWIGLNASLPDGSVGRTPDVRDARFDDAVAIRTHGASGAITGNNPRSVLLAVYRYLRALGCRWVRPGIDGELLPRIDLAASAVDLVETPSYRHRCVCIEGSVGLEHVRDMIDWLPKAGMNAYFVQFREGFAFFDRWQQESGGARMTIEQARANIAQIAAEIKRRDLIFHAVGHSWTCDPFGMPGLGWDNPTPPAPPEVVPLLAQVNGKRVLWEGIPLNTNLCYSNPEVRARMRDAIVEYAHAHPEVDLLHVWLADGENNNCECEACRDTRPADFYLMLLNEANAELTRRALATRIVFLMYVDLLWPPERERLNNPGRFVLMFAPISRTYSEAFEASADVTKPLPPFVRNKLKFPRSVDENVAFLRAWQAAAGAAVEGVDFDYHLMWDHFNDLSNMQTARVLHRDVQALADLGMDGFISCQLQRASFPTGLSMCVMAATLWDRTVDFNTLSHDYFTAAFGNSGAFVRAYLGKVSEALNPVYLRGEDPDLARAISRLQGVRNLVEALPMFKHNSDASAPCHAASWRYLDIHADVIRDLAQAYLARAKGDLTAANSHWTALMDGLQQRLPEFHHVLDLYQMRATLKGRFELK